MILDYSDYITSNASQGIVNFITTDTNINLFNHDSICPFCEKEIKNRVYYKNKKDYPEWLYGSFEQSEIVVQCPICGWWEYKYCQQSDAILDGIRATDIEYTSAILSSEYEDNSTEVPISVLRSYIEKRPEIIYNINAYKMEDLVRSIFQDFYPSCKVLAFGKTRDGGKDGILIDNEGKKTLIQVKRRTKPNATEGVDVLRSLIGASITEKNLNGCIFVSTADHFSRPAKEYAAEVLQTNYIEKFDLIDCKEFLKLLNLTSNKLPDVWEQLLRIKD